jgi:hypothetical protein
MPPGSKGRNTIKQMPNLKNQNSITTDNNDNKKFNEKSKLIRAQTQNSHRAVNDKESFSSMSQFSKPSKASQPDK